MRKTLIALTLLSTTLGSQIQARENYSTVIDQPIGDRIGWTNELFIKDLNQDNNLDIFLLFEGRRGVHYLNNGDGTFSDGTWFLADYSTFSEPLLADFNGDGWPDLFKSGFYPGSADLSYSQEVTADWQLRQCRKMLTIDFNTDGLPDIVCAVDDEITDRNDMSYGLFMYANNGDFNFSRVASSFTNESLETRVEAFTKGDINNNGSEDIVQIVRNFSRSDPGGATKTEHHTVTTYPYRENGAYQPAVTFDTDTLHDPAEPWGGSRIKSMQLIDTNGDGNLDIVTLAGSFWRSDSPGFIAVFQGAGDGTFSQTPVKTQLASSLASEFRVADMDTDGNADLVVTYRNDHELAVQPGTSIAYGTGTSAFSAEQRLPAEQDNVWQLDTGDINADGREDIVTLSGWNTGGRLVAFSDNPGKGTGEPQVQVCAYSSSDPDGDGWGWENGVSCIVTDDSSAEKPEKILLTRNRTYPLCASAAADADNDGWGWENGSTCQVRELVDFSTPEFVERPLCLRPWLDYDGDGWGYENGRSCRAIR